MRVGLQYGFNLSSKSRIVLGATYSPKKSMHGTALGRKADINQDVVVDSHNNRVVVYDTIANMSMKGNYELPNTFGAGISYNYDNRLSLEADFTYQQWSKAKYTPINYFEVPNTKWNDRWKIAAGVSYTPNPRGSYLKRMTYRMGAFYNNDYMTVFDNNVKDYGVGVGFSFPALNKTLVNLGVEWKHRYTTPNTLIKEDYLNVTLSVNFNEMWFWKNKIR
jgi:long-subunit fatty acid transport protein